MPVINHVKREINAKLVYVGPHGAGKRTSIDLVHARLRPECRSEVRRRGAGADELIFFDFLPREIGSVDGYHVRFHLYAMAADGSDAGALRMVLKGADGVMFVADAAPGREEANLHALVQVEEVLAFHGLDAGSLPLVVQLNKRDLMTGQGAEASTALFAGKGWDIQQTEASRGEGVLAAVSLLVKKVMKELRRSGVQVQEPELIPEELPTEEQCLEASDVVDLAAAGPSPGAEKGGWRCSVAVHELPEKNGVLTLPVLLTHADGRCCRLTVTVAVTEEGV